MKIEIYGTDKCKHCVKAKELCEHLNLDYTYMNIEENVDLFMVLYKKLGLEVNTRITVPQIFVDDTHIGGFTQFQTWTLFNIRGNT